MAKKWIRIAAAWAAAAVFAVWGVPAACAEAGPGVFSDLFSKRDLRGTWEDAVNITLNGDSAEADGGGVTVDGGTVTVTGEGAYVLSGALNGMIVVDCDEGAKVQLVLSGASVTSESSAALYVKEADKVFVTLAEGTENTLANGGTFTDIDGKAVDAAVYSTTDLTVNGSGALTVVSPAGHGIVSKDDLAVAGGVISVTAAKRGLSGKDSVRIADGAVAVSAGTDGIHAENSNKADKGFVYIGGGVLQVVSSGGDGISASSWVQVDGGTVTVTCSGASAQKVSDEMGGRGGFGGRGGWGGFGGRENREAASGDEASVKGIKADSALWITGGTVTVTSNSDALHSNGSLTVTGGEVTLNAGDDGLHADDALEISGGAVTVADSYEAIEAGNALTLSGGTVSVRSSDDGLNLSGSGTLTVSDGRVTVVAGNDAMDSNGTIRVTGGELYLYTASGMPMTGAIDTDRGAYIGGGTVLAIDAGSGLSFNSGDQAHASVRLSGGEGTDVTVTEGGGTVLVSWTAPGAFSYVVFSAPTMAEGETYTVTAGGQSAEAAAVTSSEMWNNPWGNPGQGGWGPPGGGWGNPGGGRGR